jgi:hypothetical protein
MRSALMTGTVIQRENGVDGLKCQGNLLTRLLFGVPPLDPVTFGGPVALFAIIGLPAC